MMPIEVTTIQNRILLIRNQQVMIDRDIAELYGVETKRLNEQVKRNIERFPEEFMFQITREEFESVKSQFATSRNNMFVGQEGGTRKLPYVFTEHGITMLASVLRSESAVNASIQIVKAFVAMRKFFLSNAQIFQRLDSLEIHRIESDKRIDELFTRMDRYKIDDTQGIFFQGQIFDAYAKFQSFIAQYPTLTVRHTTSMHDRFLIIDNSTLYHLGASLKDLGRKCFAFELFDASFISDILDKV